MDSPLAPILHTNTVPSNAQHADIHDFLASPLQKLASPLQKLADLDKHLASCLTQGSSREVRPAPALRGCISRARFADAHAMLRAIFYETLPSTRNTALISQECPLLCRISKLWRSIALTTPHISASIHIVVPRLDRMDSLIKGVNTWFIRSGNVPLAIPKIMPHSANNHHLPALFSLIISVANRWQFGHSPVSFLEPAVLLPSLTCVPTLLPSNDEARDEPLTWFRRRT